MSNKNQQQKKQNTGKAQANNNTLIKLALFSQNKKTKTKWTQQTHKILIKSRSLSKF